MNRAILPNFGFEYELCERPVPRPAAALEYRFATLLRLVPGWREAAVHTAGPVDDLLPWGWSRRAVELCPGHADVDVVRQVNDKCFSHAVEHQLGVALLGARIVEGVEDVKAAVEQLACPWIVKHPFGVAGREQVRGTGWDDGLARRLAKLFDSTQQALFEPQVEIEREFSVHFDCAGSQPELVGVAGLHADRTGTFRGNFSGATVGMDVLGIALDAARATMDAGYRGPLGVDGFETAEITRPVSEINARWSFGRLSLELARCLNCTLIWHHGPAKHRPVDLLVVPDYAPPGCWLLPDWCDPAGLSGTWIEVLDSAREN